MADTRRTAWARHVTQLVDIRYRSGANIIGKGQHVHAHAHARAALQQNVGRTLADNHALIIVPGAAAQHFPRDPQLALGRVTDTANAAAKPRPRSASGSTASLTASSLMEA